MSDRPLAVTGAMVEQIQAFADRMEDPENWTIMVPIGYFESVMGHLETDESGLGTTYRGASLCYTHDHDEVWVRYSAPLAESQHMEGEK